MSRETEGGRTLSRALLQDLAARLEPVDELSDADARREFAMTWMQGPASAKVAWQPAVALARYR